jgi:hypothetical protein
VEFKFYEVFTDVGRGACVITLYKVALLCIRENEGSIIVLGRN